MLNKFSTVMYEVYRARKPLIYIVPYQPQHFPMGLELSAESPETFNQICDRLLSDAAWREQILVEQDQALSRHCSFGAEQGFPIALDTIYSVLAASGESEKSVPEVFLLTWRLALGFQQAQLTQNLEPWIQACKWAHTQQFLEQSWLQTYTQRLTHSG
jgi:hypothetical protein